MKLISHTLPPFSLYPLKTSSPWLPPLSLPLPHPSLLSYFSLPVPPSSYCTVYNRLSVTLIQMTFSPLPGHMLQVYQDFYISFFFFFFYHCNASLVSLLSLLLKFHYCVFVRPYNFPRSFS